MRLLFHKTQNARVGVCKCVCAGLKRRYVAVTRESVCVCKGGEAVRNCLFHNIPIEKARDGVCAWGGAMARRDKRRHGGQAGYQPGVSSLGGSSSTENRTKGPMYAFHSQCTNTYIHERYYIYVIDR